MNSWIILIIGASFALIGGAGLKELADCLTIFEQGLLTLIFIGMVFVGYATGKENKEV